MGLPTLQSFYYLDHFHEVLRLVERRCPDALEDGHRNFVESFRALDREAQALLVRMINRKGAVFRTGALDYAEIPDRDGALARLRAAGLARVVRIDDLHALLERLTKPELLVLLADHGIGPSGFRSRSKSALLEKLETAAEREGLFRGVERIGWVAVAQPERSAFLLFLYFGHGGSNLTAFALRDLGLIQTRKLPAEAGAVFPDGALARHAFFYSQLRDRIRSGRPGDWLALAEESARWPRLPGTDGDPPHDRALARLGACLEKSGALDAARQVYRLSDSHPAVERLCRLDYAAGEREACRSRLERLIDDPPCDEALAFAEDFHARKFGGRRLGALTALLREAEGIRIDESYRGSPERGVLAALRRRGLEAYHGENAVWRACFGLVFWDELYGPDGAGPGSEFSLAPRGLDGGGFYQRFRPRIEAKLEALRGAPNGAAFLPENPEALPENAFFRSGGDGLPAARALLGRAPGPAIAATLGRLASGFRQHGSGFPDLLVFDRDGPRFVEVKAEGDQLRRSQLAQLRQLRAEGFRSSILRVEWCVDPEQTYVVVDVETTGGRPPHHRVTEIGAVKLRGGRVLDRFQTLLNPERRIPRRIVELTGIRNEDVATAPKFAEIARAFSDFVGDAVFVAHHAKFDHGFIRAEFGRVGVEFNRPTLCTAAEARRWFKGLPSYRLKSLCAHFGIPLDRHHRALCDAEATARLLLEINRKRAGGGGPREAEPTAVGRRLGAVGEPA